jgi:2,4-dienoyl-CoA reductase-like NADH-dependent reductase (Old Yellow Enzyme family)
MRFPLRVAKAVRAQWPQDRPMFVRISAVDGVGVGWAIEDSIAFAKALARVGVDAIDCSTGGLRIDRDKQVAARTPGFQVAYAARIRAAAGVPTMAVGLIRSPRQAEEIMREGKADLIALAREMLVNPNWPAEAARELSGGSDWQLWPQQFRYWLERRARSLGEVGAR